MACITAIETNQLQSLPKIDGIRSEIQKHRRTSSYPKHSILNKSKTNEKVKVSSLRPCQSMPNLSDTKTGCRRQRSSTTVDKKLSFKFQKKVSFRESDTVEATEDVPYFEYREPSSASPQVPITILKVDDIQIHTDYRLSPDYQKTPTKPVAATKKLSMMGFFDHASDASKVISKNSSPIMSTSPTELLFTSRAVEGDKICSTSPIAQSFTQQATRNRKSSRQNLAYFIQTLNTSSRTKVALDRENAHFHLSEAIIATSQQLKMNRMLDQKYKIPKTPNLREMFRETPRQISHQNLKRLNTKFVVGSLEDDSESQSSIEESEKVASSTSSEDVTIDTAPQMEWNCAPHSAESIAMMLMTKFKNQQLPNPNKLLWLVNESQAPQQLLPFPDLSSYPINPDEPFHHSFIRGSKDWAPPRQQIIFTVHPPPDRRRLLLQQNHRCTGCGMKVAPAHVHTFRYCDYLGKYFCSACHKNQISVIPARVLEKWEFSLYPVSNFSYRWLEEIWNLPLFHVGDLKPQLYEKAKALAKARNARIRLRFIQDFVTQCRFAEKEKEFLKSIPNHWLDDVDIWNMNDFVDVKNGEFNGKIEEIIKKLEKHVIEEKCELCNARGWLCELCPNSKREIIFPWQEKIKRCVHCGSCYHEKCYIKKECSKCERLKRHRYGKNSSKDVKAL